MFELLYANPCWDQMPAENESYNMHLKVCSLFPFTHFTLTELFTVKVVEIDTNSDAHSGCHNEHFLRSPKSLSFALFAVSVFLWCGGSGTIRMSWDNTKKRYAHMYQEEHGWEFIPYKHSWAHTLVYCFHSFLWNQLNVIQISTL